MARAKKTLAFAIYPLVNLLELDSTLGFLRALLLRGFEVRTVGRTFDPIPTDTPLRIAASARFDDVLRLHALFVVGSSGIHAIEALGDDALVEYVRAASPTCELVGSVGSGSLMLTAAGLIQDQVATTHWADGGLLAELGARSTRSCPPSLRTAPPWSARWPAARMSWLPSTACSPEPGSAITPPRPRTTQPRRRRDGTEDHRRRDLPRSNDPRAGRSPAGAERGRPAPPRVPAGGGGPPCRPHDGRQRRDVRARHDVPRRAAPVRRPGARRRPRHPRRHERRAAARLHEGAAAHAEVVAGVCTGALLLASVGLLRGRQATTHWAYRGILERYGTIYLRRRWVEEGNFIMSAGVSAGIDTALRLAPRLTDDATAREVQLRLDYDPDPPFGGIDSDRIPLMARAMRGMHTLLAPIITRRSDRLTAQGR